MIQAKQICTRVPVILVRRCDSAWECGHRRSYYSAERLFVQSARCLSSNKISRAPRTHGLPSMLRRAYQRLPEADGQRWGIHVGKDRPQKAFWQSRGHARVAEDHQSKSRAGAGPAPLSSWDSEAEALRRVPRSAPYDSARRSSNVPREYIRRPEWTAFLPVI